MRTIIGIVTVFGCVATGYAMHHGKFGVLWQPNEVVIIFGASIGSVIISNSSNVLKGILRAVKVAFGSSPYKKKEYMELLSFLYSICKVMKTKGMLQVEPALDAPHESELFTAYPKFLANHHGVEFFTDYLRMVTMGLENPFQLEDLMEKEVEAHHHELEEAASAITNMGDGLPALGIVAAVLGVIQTMGSIAEPPEILGGLIGAALVGTFLGILMGYGLVGPLASVAGKFANEETAYYNVLKAAILAHVQGNAPVITIEVARKVIPPHVRPSFNEVDQMINGDAAG